MSMQTTPGVSMLRSARAWILLSISGCLVLSDFASADDSSCRHGIVSCYAATKTAARVCVDTPDGPELASRDVDGDGLVDIFACADDSYPGDGADDADSDSDSDGADTDSDSDGTDTDSDSDGTDTDSDSDGTDTDSDSDGDDHGDCPPGGGSGPDGGDPCSYPGDADGDGVDNSIDCDCNGGGNGGGGGGGSGGCGGDGGGGDIPVE